MMHFVEQQIGHAEKQLQNISDGGNLDVLAVEAGLPPRVSGTDIVMSPGMHMNNPTVYGNTQTGYRADLRFGADVRPVMNCHQCKTNKKIEELVFCGHISIDAKGYSTTCTKRYCRTCLWNWYMEQAPGNEPDSEPMWNIWRCPSCRKLCCCHRCRTFGKIQRGLDMCDLQEQAGALSPARCLARALDQAPEAMRLAGDDPTVRVHPDQMSPEQSPVVCVPCPVETDTESSEYKPSNPKPAKRRKTDSTRTRSSTRIKRNARS